MCAWQDGRNGVRDRLRELGGGGDGAGSDNCCCDSSSELFVAVLLDDPGEFSLVIPVHDVGSGPLLFAVHPHIEWTIVAI